MRRERVGDPVGADLAGVVDAQPNAGLDPGRDEERWLRQVLLAEPLQRRRERRHDAADDDRVDGPERDIVARQKAIEKDRQLVLGAVMDGRGAPCRGERVVAEHAERDLGVSDVDREQQHA